MMRQRYPDQREEPKQYAQLEPSVRELDFQMYGHTMPLIQLGAGVYSGGCLFYKDKVERDNAFASFVELILYIYSTKTLSPINEHK